MCTRVRKKCPTGDKSYFGNAHLNGPLFKKELPLVLLWKNELGKVFKVLISAKSQSMFILFVYVSICKIVYLCICLLCISIVDAQEWESSECPTAGNAD